MEWKVGVGVRVELKVGGIEGKVGVRVEWKAGVGVTLQGNKATQCQQNHHHRCFKFRILMVIGMKERLYRLRFAKGASHRLPEGNILKAS